MRWSATMEISRIRRQLPALALTVVAATGHVGYPVYLAWRTRGRPVHDSPPVDDWPGVSVIVPAYLESSVIAEKVAQLRSDDYPGPLEIIVVADDPGTYSAALQTGARVLGGEARLGKGQA